MNAPATSSGPRQVGFDLPQPIVQQTAERALIEVFSQQQVAECEGLIAHANAAVPIDAATNAAAERTLLRLHDALKAVEARRVELKKPIAQMGKAIEEIAAKLAEPMDAAKRSLQGRIIAFSRAAREKAEKERQEAETAARREREAAEAAALAKAAQEAKDLADVLGEPVVVEPEPVAPVAPRAPIPTAPPSAVQPRKVLRVVIDDPSLIPYRVADQVLMHPDHAAIKRVLGLGINIPGARLVEDEQVAMAGRRP